MKASGCTTAKLHLTYASDRYKGNHMQSGNSLAESIAAVSDVAIPLNKKKMRSWPRKTFQQKRPHGLFASLLLIISLRDLFANINPVYGNFPPPAGQRVLLRVLLDMQSG